MNAVAERFWAKVDVQDFWSCWEWTAAKMYGYGRFSVQRGLSSRKAHRVAYWLTHGEWPNVCRHKCDNPGCVNPLHLEDGTLADNNRDMAERNRAANQNTYKTMCKRGHPLSGDNLYVYSDGSRLCRECNYESGRRRRERLRNEPEVIEG